MDYHNISDINTTKEERERLNIGPIYSNGVKCLCCGWYLRSRSRHDFVQCQCKNKTFVDGGSFYVKYGGENMSKVQVRTIYYSDVSEDVSENVSKDVSPDAEENK